MEKLRYTIPKTLYKKTIWAELAAAAVTAAGLIMCACDMFGFGYTLAEAFSGGIGGGMINVWNAIADAFGNQDYVILPSFEGASGSSGLFITLCLVLTITFAFLIARSGRAWPFLIFAIPPAIINTVFGLPLRVDSCAVLCIGIVTSILIVRHGTEGLLKNLFFMTTVIIAAAGIISIPAVSKSTEAPLPVASLRTDVASLAENMYYGRNPLKSGELTGGQRESGYETALEITMSAPHSTYLRGFIGDTYRGDRWDTLSNSLYYSRRNLMYWLKQSGFNAFGQTSQVKSLVGTEEDDEQNGTISIKTEKADARYAYIPYEIEGEVEGTRTWGGSFMTAGKFGRLTEYSYAAGDNSVKDWTETAARIFTQEDTENEEKIQAYLISESYYNQYVYQNYRYVSAADRELINDFLGGSGDQTKGHVDYKTAIENIKTYLKDNYIYTEDIGKEGDGAGSMLETFFESKKGYDVHFATAAVLMFRYYGIPARYAEGYLVTPEDAENMESGEPYELPLSRAHAWPEIYIDGVGFVPVEVSPDYIGLMEEADMNVGISNSSLVREFDEEINDDTQGRYEIGGDDALSLNTDIATIVLCILAAIVIGSLLTAISKKVWQRAKTYCRRRKIFMKAPPKMAVSAIYDFMESKDYPVKEEIVRLGNKAAYSRFPMTEKDRKTMLEYMKDAKKEKKEDEKNRGKESNNTDYAGHSDDNDSRLRRGRHIVG